MKKKYIDAAKTVKIERDNIWLGNKRWSIPSSVNNLEEDKYRRNSRKPLTEEQKHDRRQHMQSLHKEGASYAMIGRLYSLNRSTVFNIINEKV